MVYTIDKKIGRRDSRDIIKINVVSVVSGTASLLPAYPLGRRNFIRIKNLDGANSVYLLANADDSYATEGYEVPHGEEWEENTDAPLYAISTVSGTVSIQTYERSGRFNYKK
jgi:hypothetical protein